MKFEKKVELLKYDLNLTKDHEEERGLGDCNNSGRIHEILTHTCMFINL